MSDIEGSMNDLARALERLPTREERLAEEERRAWDMYVAGVLADTNATKDLAVVTADYVLAERRKHFGAGKGYVTIHSDVLRVALRVLGEVDWPHPDARFGPIMGIRAALEAAGLDETPAKSGVSE